MTAILEQLYAAFVKAFVSNIGGFRGWLAKLALRYGGKALFDMLSDWERKYERAKVQVQAKKEYETVVKNPQSTVEERAKAYEAYINSGR